MEKDVTLTPGMGRGWRRVARVPLERGPGSKMKQLLFCVTDAAAK
jgi:hypothetical protein